MLGGAAAGRQLTGSVGSASVALIEGKSGGVEANLGNEFEALKRIAQKNADDAAATSVSGFRVTAEGKGSGGRGLGANKIVDRVAHEYAGAVQQANRILKTNRSPKTAWERIFRDYIAAGKIPPAYVRGNAIQQVADDLMRSNRYAQVETRSIVNRQSRVPELHTLRPDLQVPLSPTTQGIIDITTPG